MCKARMEVLACIPGKQKPRFVNNICGVYWGDNPWNEVLKIFAIWFLMLGLWEIYAIT